MTFQGLTTILVVTRKILSLRVYFCRLDARVSESVSEKVIELVSSAMFSLADTTRECSCGFSLFDN